MFSFSWRAIVGALIVAAPLSAAEALRAGAAKADVTPPTGFPMWGYGARKDAPCDGVLDPLLARAVVLTVGDEKLAIVSLDLGRAPTRAVTAAIRERLRGTGITRLFLGASHTHHGPVLELDTWPDAKNPYVRQLERKLGDVILEAAANLRPARLGVASRQVALNRNRQSKRPDAPVDRELLVVRVESEDGRPVAHLVNFAAHATMSDSHVNKFSADYPGAMAALVEKETAAPCLFLQGAAGDLSANPPAGVSGPQAFGAALGREVLGLIPTIRWGAPERPTLSGCNETFRFRARLDVSNPLVRAGLSRAFFPELIAAYEREYAEGVRPELEVALLNGDLGIVGVSGEFFCGHALSLKRRARLGHLLFVGYCNDYQQYFPTLEAAAEGGYGTLPPVAMAELGAGERVTDRALYHLYRLRGKLSE